MTARSLAVVDWARADVAANRIVLAYELADMMADYSGDTAEQRASAVTIATITTVFSLIDLGVTEKEAVAEFRKIFRSVGRTVDRFGDDCRLRDVLTEMHLDQSK